METPVDFQFYIGDLEYEYSPIYNNVCPSCDSPKRYYFCEKCGAEPCVSYGCGKTIRNGNICRVHFYNGPHYQEPHEECTKL